jgi:hypothetical protein
VARGRGKRKENDEGRIMPKYIVSVYEDDIRLLTESC